MVDILVPFQHIHEKRTSRNVPRPLRLHVNATDISKWLDLKHGQLLCLPTIPKVILKDIGLYFDDDVNVSTLFDMDVGHGFANFHKQEVVVDSLFDSVSIKLDDYRKRDDIRLDLDKFCTTHHLVEHGQFWNAHPIIIYGRNGWMTMGTSPFNNDTLDYREFEINMDDVDTCYFICFQLGGMQVSGCITDEMNQFTFYLTGKNELGQPWMFIIHKSYDDCDFEEWCFENTRTSISWRKFHDVQVLDIASFSTHYYPTLSSSPSPPAMAVSISRPGNDVFWITGYDTIIGSKAHFMFEFNDVDDKKYYKYKSYDHTAGGDALGIRFTYGMDDEEYYLSEYRTIESNKMMMQAPKGEPENEQNKNNSNDDDDLKAVPTGVITTFRGEQLIEEDEERKSTPSVATIIDEVLHRQPKLICWKKLKRSDNGQPCIAKMEYQRERSGPLVIPVMQDAGIPNLSPKYRCQGCWIVELQEYNLYEEIVLDATITAVPWFVSNSNIIYQAKTWVEASEPVDTNVQRQCTFGLHLHLIRQGCFGWTFDKYAQEDLIRVLLKKYNVTMNDLKLPPSKSVLLPIELQKQIETDVQQQKRMLIAQPITTTQAAYRSESLPIAQAIAQPVSEYEQLLLQHQHLPIAALAPKSESELVDRAISNGKFFGKLKSKFLSWLEPKQKSINAEQQQKNLGGGRSHVKRPPTSQYAMLSQSLLSSPTVSSSLSSSSSLSTSTASYIPPSLTSVVIGKQNEETKSKEEDWAEAVANMPSPPSFKTESKEEDWAEALANMPLPPSSRPPSIITGNQDHTVLLEALASMPPLPGQKPLLPSILEEEEQDVLSDPSDLGMPVLIIN